MVCILLDSEGRNDAERQKYENESHGALRFLERRRLENYLLYPDAVAAVLGELGESLTLDCVEKGLSNAAKTHGQLLDFSNIDGAKVLAETFSTITESRQEFVKTRDVPLLVTWILKNYPERLTTLKEFLRQLFGL